MKSILIFRSSWGSVLIALIVFVIGLAFPLHKTLADPDIYLHVATGQQIISTFSVPVSDSFSYVKYGEPWVAHEWLAQVMMALLHQELGWFGVLLLASLAFSVSVGIQFRFLSQRFEPLQTLAFLLVGYAGLLTHFQARPHVLVWPLMALWVASLLNAGQDRQPPSKWLLILLLLWVNMHGSFVLGLVLLPFIAFEAVRNDSQQWRGWIKFSLLSILVCMVNPYGWHSLIFPFDLQSMSLLGEITEWSSPNGLLFLPIVALLMTTAFYAVVGRLRVDLVYVPLLLMLLYQAFSHARYVSIALFLIPFFLKKGKRSAQMSSDQSATMSCLAGKYSVGIFAAFSIGLVALGFQHFRQFEPSWKTTPEAAVDALFNMKIDGNGINMYGYGGYLIYRGIPVFIDGRFDLYRDAHLARYLDATRSDDPVRIKAVLNDFNVQWTLFMKRSPINDYFDGSPDWVKRYEDDQAIIFVRQDRPFIQE